MEDLTQRNEDSNYAEKWPFNYVETCATIMQKTEDRLCYMSAI